MPGSNEQDDESYVIKLRGLPWSTTVDEIIKFFSDCNIRGGKAGIHMTMSREGRPSGEAYVEMETDEDIDQAVKRDRDHMGQRYIEVFRVKKSEMEWVVKRSGLNLETTMDDGCVRLRGLPFGCSKEEIAQFFSGLEIVPNGITLPTDYTGRSTGEAYVQFVNREVAEKALQKHKEKIGHRYIEIFRSSLSEVRAAIGPKIRPLGPGGFGQRPAPYDRGDRFGGVNRYASMGRGSRSFKGFNEFDDGPSPWMVNTSWGGRGRRPGQHAQQYGGPPRGGHGHGAGPQLQPEHHGPPSRPLQQLGQQRQRPGAGVGGGHSVHMRGLPFRATQDDIADFFRPLVPVNIRLLYDNSGRASGEADVEFATHEEATKAMSKDKGHMQHRYIELFLVSTPGPAPGTGDRFGNFGGATNFGGGGTTFGGGLATNFQRSNFTSSNLGGGGGNYGGQLSGSNFNNF
ncbi:LOW QUALITY PROTEIN: heterogeneous nuclear ribonucleoprotein H2 [Bacillus rossius redtenbacheri]|uniref:LOW QUALITY PROTEIN: heterogeneous nuclear ribonucleoprotein H2 n=1 Tax=Bacillus rossius redtenbacheri TaxID=93214 RepID=UPI002FDE69C3